ncbi:MAG: hypothetical protein U5M50_16415 [Sphingobium sp.]|nr:hypothetical protein [Sphingobium sp.]
MAARRDPSIARDAAVLEGWRTSPVRSCVLATHADQALPRSDADEEECRLLAPFSEAVLQLPC